MKKNITLNKNERTLITLLNEKEYLSPKDFHNIFGLSPNGTRAKIKHFLCLRWIRVADKKAVVYRFVKGEECPEVGE